MICLFCDLLEMKGHMRPESGMTPSSINFCNDKIENNAKYIKNTIDSGPGADSQY